ncbi:MAG: glutamine-hydrolyzing carbamoyl-phosphate synthase small subunit, partial [Candidatus Omnitrophica bacterium]|nr:glutamine-hydrolyzing carbamoyl-phosphate synthase small subunit [Candidatus Omnitrophota bacterium]
TAMTGYQEILTDPSYAGQIVTMTYPLIGNYGVNEEDIESKKIHVEGFVVKEFCRTHSNYRAMQSLIDYLNENNIIAIEGIDTRALTRHLRLQGTMKAILSTEDFDPASLSKKLDNVPSMEGRDWVSKVTTEEKYIWKDDEAQSVKYKVAAIDCGIKFNILRILSRLGCQVHVFPARASVEEIKAINPDGLFISNGPGDPAGVPYVAQTVKRFFGKIPVFGICLGHQIIARSQGIGTYKMHHGHRGLNHPIKNLVSGLSEITSQNHGFAISEKDVEESSKVEATHINLNDDTIEGLSVKGKNAFSVQYHPEASPGPHDSRYLFDQFVENIKK